ncbi:MAG: prephenate dehydrogenase [Victivallaceae bacterium]|nr:prephenate dehydrogenase [Victivallaceae bacterium]
MTIKNCTVAVIGLGLLGASLGMALRGKCAKVLGWARREETRRRAVEVGAVDETGDDPAAILARADLTVLCLPIPVIIDFLRANAGYFKKGAAVTDIGSVKSSIVAAGEAALGPLGVFFVGSHPMAGTEKTGLDAAFKTLYRHAEVFVTPTAASPEPAVALVTEMWEAIGTRVNLLAPGPHDELVAHTSHISHLLALGLTLSVLDEQDEHLLRLRFSGCATGFRDTSRIASSSPLMWRQIVEANRGPVLQAIAEFEAKFSLIKQLITEERFDEFERLFGEGKFLRDSWIGYKNKEHGCNW